MVTIIYENDLNGHHLEYLHHIYNRAIKVPQVKFIFIVPHFFIEKSKLLLWDSASNVVFDYIPDEEAEKTVHNKFHSIGMQFNNAKLMCRYIKKYNPDHFFTPGGMLGFPYIDFFLSANSITKISSVCYSIWPYYFKNLPMYKKVLVWYTYNHVIKKKNYHVIFVLNNKKYLNYYNQKFCYGKFKYLTDPVTTDKNIGCDIRSELNISRDKKIFIHVGAMEHVKGTINILKALQRLSHIELDNNHFIFAGNVGASIKKEFYNLLSRINRPDSISVYDKFCEYDFFCSLYKTCDYVLFPYPPRPNSSGLLGNAALFNKPVITTRGGAIGDLVTEYNLGLLMDDNSPESIIKAIRETDKIQFTPDRYVAEHTREEFCNQIFEVITK